MSPKRQIVIKLGTSVLTGGTRRLDRRRMLEIVHQTVRLREREMQAVIVSSGAIAAGRELLGYPTLNRTVSAKQMLAAVGQGRLIQLYAELFGIFEVKVGQVLLTRGDLANRTGYLNARDTLRSLLDQGIVPIINENDTIATEEIRVGDNDNLSALVANLIDADTLILLTDQLGLYDADPRTNAGAQLIHVVERIDDKVFALAGGTSSGLGTGGMITKLQAAQLAGRSGTTTVIASGAIPDVILEVAAGKPLGTTFLPQITRRESRKRWLLSEKPGGFVSVDRGAAERLRKRGASLLPVGVKSVKGNFERGAPVHLLDPEGVALGVGMTTYSSAEIKQLIGAKSAQIIERLGYTYGDEVIHRDNLALFEGIPDASEG
ncbi:MAG: glutamate 5-kinase [Anaerolinea sp.]|nr:glutamate 5-kinase [Anaerolinea sp.]MCC6973198.1 glutamate 5-kinase [Anaerolineae bacterium]CAG0954674.1 glutamate 5-kinase [Anaerolineae bacterium]